MRELIKDHRGQVIGYILDTGHLIQIFDRQNQLQGQFIKHSNQTVDRTGRLFGYGNQLVRLLGR